MMMMVMMVMMMMIMRIVESQARRFWSHKQAEFGATSETLPRDILLSQIRFPTLSLQGTARKERSCASGRQRAIFASMAPKQS